VCDAQAARALALPVDLQPVALCDCHFADASDGCVEFLAAGCSCFFHSCCCAVACIPTGHTHPNPQPLQRRERAVGVRREEAQGSDCPAAGARSSTLHGLRQQLARASQHRERLGSSRRERKPPTQKTRSARGFLALHRAAGRWPLRYTRLPGLAVLLQGTFLLTEVSGFRRR
jgi:hypothetical protein